ncbi:MAG TPA: hypothetical protein DCZ95_04610 [Verrucomicrobia bacterium]|nr:MAG: hypothetical protein A2X46_14520 [Lentisphaerae bacterium GWF2_57_35]HBA83359.1 hypothetical protein [Verrucomicrobiota bacterium]
MPYKEIFFLVFAIFGGLTLFMYGMSVMTEGLRLAAGARLRAILSHTTRSRPAGLLLGTVLGFVAHSGPTLVMLIGFVNAGLITLPEAIAPMLGANVGTTLSMQMISFHLNDYSYFIMAVGFLLRCTARKTWQKYAGQALLGFGMLFLGMDAMSRAIAPHRDLIAPWLSHVHGDTLRGLLTGVLISTLLTIAVQSSGAVIGMCFVLTQAGVFVHLEQVYPIVLGAHIGTCTTALLGSIGASIEARRVAFSHLYFNVFGVLVAIAAAPWFIRAIERSAADLVHQTANLHTAVMIVAAVLILPVSSWFAGLVRWTIRSKLPPPKPSFLDEKLIPFPEQALAAAIQELQRVMQICAKSFRLTAEIFFEPERRKVLTVKLNENVIDDIKKAMKAYLEKLTLLHLSRRQAILLVYLTRCITDIERIGDHIDELCDISIRRSRVVAARFDHATLEVIFDLYKAAEKVLRLVIDSLKPDQPDFQMLAETILNARNDYMEKSLNARASFMERLAEHQCPPIQGIYFHEYLACLDRIVKHAKTIALVEKQPFFWIKRKKLRYLGNEAPDYTPPPLADPRDFLDKLQSESYL